MRACAWGAECVCVSRAQAGARCWFWVTQNLYIYGIVRVERSGRIGIELTQAVSSGSWAETPMEVDGQVRWFHKANLEEVIGDEHVPLAP